MLAKLNKRIVRMLADSTIHAEQNILGYLYCAHKNLFSSPGLTGSYKLEYYWWFLLEGEVLRAENFVTILLNSWKKYWEIFDTNV